MQGGYIPEVTSIVTSYITEATTQQGSIVLYYSTGDEQNKRFMNGSTLVPTYSYRWRPHRSCRGLLRSSRSSRPRIPPDTDTRSQHRPSCIHDTVDTGSDCTSQSLCCTGPLKQQTIDRCLHLHTSCVGQSVQSTKHS